MTALTIYFLITGAMSPVIGRIVDRYGAPRVMAIGAVVAGTGFMLLSTIESLWQFYLFYSITGFGMSAAGMVSTTTVVSNWFEKRRGMAIGIMSAGLGAGGLVLSPIIGSVIIPDLGWRNAYVAIAILIWLLIPLALFVIKTRPPENEGYVDGILNPVGEAQEKQLNNERKITPRMALLTISFWLMVISFLTHGFSEVGVLQTQVPFLEDKGYPLATASGILGGVGFWSLIGKFGFGWLCDRIDAKYVCIAGLALQLTGTIVLINVHSDSPIALVWLYSVIMGLGVGSWLPTMSMLVSSRFGLASYGAIFGMISFAQSTGAATGPMMTGYIFDLTGDYTIAFTILISSYVVSLLSIIAVRRIRIRRITGNSTEEIR